MYREAPTPKPILLVALGGNVLGLDPTSGEVLWRNNLPGGGLGSVDLATDGDIVIASASGNSVFAMTYATGKTLWHAVTTAHGRATIILEADRIFVAKGGFVDAYSRVGEPLWKQGLPGLGTGRGAMGFPGNLRQADDIGG